MSTQQGINSLINANSVEALKNQLIPLLTDINDNTGGGGVQSVTGNVVDDTDPQNPVVDVNIDPNTALLIEVTRAEIIGLFPSFDINPKACYRITDSAAGIIRVWGKSATELTATAMKEGSDDGSTVTNGQWGNYDLDGDVFTPDATSGVYTPVVSNIIDGGTVTVEGSSFYQKIGNIVICSFRLRMTPNTGNYVERFNLTLPILPLANFGANNLVNGSMTIYHGTFADINECNIKSKSGAKTLDITISTISPDTEVGVSIHVQYSI